MREVFIFAIGAALTFTVFMVSLLELFFTIRRRKSQLELENRVKDIKASYNNAINDLVIKDDAQIIDSEKKLESVSSTVETEKEVIEQTYQEKIDKLTAQSEKALQLAKQKAKKLEEAAKIQADEYVKSRQSEVEQQLMNLVLSVTKKVLPAGLTYETQKKLVLEALQDVKAQDQA